MILQALLQQARTSHAAGFKLGVFAGVLGFEAIETSDVGVYWDLVT